MRKNYLVSLIIFVPVLIFGQSPVLVNNWKENAFFSQNGAIVFEPAHPSPDLTPISPVAMNFRSDGSITVFNWRWCAGEQVASGSQGTWEVKRENGTETLVITLANHNCIMSFTIVEISPTKLVLEPAC